MLFRMLVAGLTPTVGLLALMFLVVKPGIERNEIDLSLTQEEAKSNWADTVICDNSGPECRPIMVAARGSRCLKLLTEFKWDSRDAARREEAFQACLIQENEARKK